MFNHCLFVVLNISVIWIYFEKLPQIQEGIETY